MPYRPTEEQQAVIAHDRNTHARVLAGPGTGKSATVVALVDELLAGEPAPRVKLITFTRAATAELAKKVSDHPAAAAERPSTMHSFSISVLLRNPGTGHFPKPLRIADDWETDEIVKPTLARRINVYVRKLSDLIREMAAGWEYLEAIHLQKVDPTERARFLAGWNEHRDIFGYTLLAELPFALRQALRDHADLDGVAFDLLIVDEYQDLNACDLEVLHLVADRGCSIIAAGDDDQSIYSFRHAAPAGIRKFCEDYPGATTYPLSISQRCGSQIINWASYVIDGDLDRPAGRPHLQCSADSPLGEVALLVFPDETSEARGVAEIVFQLTHAVRDPLRPEDILILVRGDYTGSFTEPIKQALTNRQIPFSDPEAVIRMLGEDANRRMLATFRLLVNDRDSLAWATVLKLTPGVGDKCFDYLYERARASHVQFGQAFSDAYAAGFPDGPKTCNRMAALFESVTVWLATHRPPDETPETGWGHWMIETAANDFAPGPSDACRELLMALDGLVEPDFDFGRFLSQITPLGKDRAIAESKGVRIMTMIGSKGLTVRATIIAGLDHGIMPRPDADASEERRLLYVAMTRAKEFLFGTWAGRRFGRTARAGGQAAGEWREHSRFLTGGPVQSQNGLNYLATRRGEAG
jgi:DNA helicase II / ATP-dependent DNA helicase PcrA